MSTTSYACYSEKARKLGSSVNIWRLADGSEVAVTGVVEDPDTYRFVDKVVYDSPAVAWVRAVYNPYGRSRR